METAQQDPSQARRFGLILRACLVGITRGRHRSQRSQDYLGLPWFTLPGSPLGGG
jgi:hypothetical protein